MRIHVKTGVHLRYKENVNGQWTSCVPARVKKAVAQVKEFYPITDSCGSWAYTQTGRDVVLRIYPMLYLTPLSKRQRLVKFGVKSTSHWSSANNSASGLLSDENKR